MLGALLQACSGDARAMLGRCPDPTRPPSHHPWEINHRPRVADRKWMVVQLNPDASRDPRVRALAELLHQIRPTWDRAGIRSALLIASATKTFEQVTHAAIGASFDTSAHTPAVIPHRDGDAFAAKKSEQCTPLPPPVTAVLGAVEAGDYTAGAAAARAAIRAAKDAALKATAEKRAQKHPDEKEAPA